MAAARSALEYLRRYQADPFVKNIENASDSRSREIQNAKDF